MQQTPVGKTQVKNEHILLITQSSIQFCTFNVKGLASKSKRDRVLCWLNQQKFSIVLLQEFHYNSNTDDAKQWATKWNGKCF